MKNVSAGVLSAVAAVALVIGASSPALAVSSPKVHPKPQIVATGTLTVQLTDLQGHDITTADSDPTAQILIQSFDSDSYSAYATVAENDGWSEGTYAGALVHGAFTFTGVPLNNSFTVYGVGGSSYNFKTVHDVYPSTSPLHVALTKSGSISGTLLTSAGQPLAGAPVAAYNSKNGSEVDATTNEDGTYSFPTIGAGTYRIQFNAPSGRPTTDNGTFRWTYWGGSTFKSAKSLVVHSESKSKTASVFSNISGRVASSIPVTVNQWVIDPEGTESVSWQVVFVSTTAKTDSKLVQFEATDANVAIATGLNPGKYKVDFVSENLDFLTTTNWWYTGEKKVTTHSQSKAVTVTVPSSGTVTFNLGVPPTPST